MKVWPFAFFAGGHLGIFQIVAASVVIHCSGPQLGRSSLQSLNGAREIRRQWPAHPDTACPGGPCRDGAYAASLTGALRLLSQATLDNWAFMRWWSKVYFCFLSARLRGLVSRETRGKSPFFGGAPCFILLKHSPAYWWLTESTFKTWGFWFGSRSQGLKL